MANAKTQAPKLSITLSLSSSTYHFSNPTPPELRLTIICNTPAPITVFTWHSILYPKLALAQRGFIITDLTTGNSVTQTCIQLQHAAFTLIRNGPDEGYYMTISHDTPVTVSTPFGRGGHRRPQPKSIVERGWELDEDGKEMKIRRSVHAHGVDGLEPGHRYRLDVAPESLQGLWWRWGTKEEVLVDQSNPKCMLSQVQSEEAELEFEEIEGAEFGVED